MKTILYVFLVGCLSLASCKKDDHKVIPSLPGTWQETEPPLQFAGSTHRFSFTEPGAFQLSRLLFTDALEPGIPCSRPRTQYVRGTYTVAGERLTLSGRYCDSTFTTDIADCAAGALFWKEHSLTGNFGQLILDDETGDFNRIILNRE